MPKENDRQAQRGIDLTAQREADLKTRLARLEDEVNTLARLLRGNGAWGLRTQLELAAAKIDALESQWKWIVGVLTAVAVAVAQASFRK